MKIASLQSGERKALFESWMRAYENDVLRLCFAYLHSRDQAQDALQDTFLKVWRHMEKAPADGVKPWILRIAVNTCKDYRRSAWVRRVKPDDRLLAAGTVPERDDDLYLDVLSLPIQERQAVLLHHYQRLTIDETAKTMGVHRSSVVRRLKKAYRLLDYFPEGGQDR